MLMTLAPEPISSVTTMPTTVQLPRSALACSPLLEVQNAPEQPMVLLLEEVALACTVSEFGLEDVYKRAFAFGLSHPPVS